MKSYLLYLIEDLHDAALCETNEIFYFVIGETECENCAMAVGPLYDVFVPCVIMYEPNIHLEDDQSWPVCLDCAGPLIFPGLWQETN